MTCELSSIATVRECVSALAGARGPMNVVTACEVPEVDFGALEEIDAHKYPTLVAPAVCIAPITELAEHLVSMCTAGVAAVCTGYASGAVVAAFATACARSALAHRGVETLPRCVTFGLPLVFDARALVCVSIVLTTDNASMFPATLSNKGTIWLGEKDAGYYASRLLAVLARPVAGASIALYADAIDQLVWHTTDSGGSAV
jgi:xanthine/uracil permease